MKKFSRVIIGILLLIIGYQALKHGFIEDLRNKIATRQIESRCYNIQKAVVTKVAEIEITNKGNNTHRQVLVEVIAYDKNHKIIKKKQTFFNRTLEPGETLTKPLTLPNETESCECRVVKSEDAANAPAE